MQTVTEKITKILDKLPPEGVYVEYEKLKEYTAQRLTEQKQESENKVQDLEGKISNLSNNG